MTDDALQNGTSAGDAVRHPRPYVTHSVLNQVPPRVGVNEYTSNRALVECVTRYGGEWGGGELTEVGAIVGSESFQLDATIANTSTPQLRGYDRSGHRIDTVDFHPSYHRVISQAIAHGAHTRAWVDPKPGANVVRAAVYMLFAQAETGHACPVQMTQAVVPVLKNNPGVGEQWLSRVYSRDYDPRLAANKSSAIFGMSSTEKQGGSDLRATITTAERLTDGTWALTGHKWFCSAPQSDAFLIVARTAEGPSCFLVPRVLPDGTHNVFHIIRLKDKLGNRSNASAEIELDDTIGWLLGEPGHGIRTFLEMVDGTRIDCMYCSVAGMRQAVAEAAWYVRHRSAFGKLLIQQPAMTAVIADLQLEAEAAEWSALRIAAACDAGSSEEKSLLRVLTPLMKYWICKRAVNHAYEALECFGGNGYIETYPMARRFREQPLQAIWEGTSNVVALDVLRALARDRDAALVFDAEIAKAKGSSPVFDAYLETVRKEMVGMVESTPDLGSARVRHGVECMALAFAASLLLRNAPAAVAEGFVIARLGRDRSLEYGALPDGIDVSEIAARA